MSVRYNIYETKEDRLIKADCTLITVIPRGHTLTDDEVREYFGIDEDHRHWERAHRPYLKVDRYVFDKCIIPNSYAYRLEVVIDE